uniref:Pre-mRNA-splicing factor SYF2 n=1 Tax=Wollemia nobilis TaxID=56998 RepID=A0A0C9QVF8_9CONI
MAEEQRVHPECINASNPYHECVEYCFWKIAEAKERREKEETVSCKTEENTTDCGNGVKRKADELNTEDERINQESLNAKDDVVDANNQESEKNNEDAGGADYLKLTGRQKKLFELRLKMNEARKANQMDILAEKKRQETQHESRGISKQKWIEDKKKTIGKQLDANGLDMTKAYMLDTQEAAEVKYKKWEKNPAPFGWDVFNQKSLYNAYKKRTKNIPFDMDDYLKAKETDPEFYRDGSSMQYGKAPNIPEENIEKMVKELEDRDQKRKQFSRRRRFHEEKDIDSINDRNEHFNKKIERAFGKYTVEIKNNLERGTALPD